jgi:Arc/MetJ-type ribon-helix-helix transcriptional regulator
MNTPDTVAVHLPRALYDVIAQRAQDGEWTSPEEYIVFVLTTLTEDEAAETEDQPDMTAEEEGKVMERLRGLGYLE